MGVVLLLLYSIVGALYYSHLSRFPTCKCCCCHCHTGRALEECQGMWSWPYASVCCMLLPARVIGLWGLPVGVCVVTGMFKHCVVLCPVAVTLFV